MIPTTLINHIISVNIHMFIPTTSVESLSRSPFAFRKTLAWSSYIEAWQQKTVTFGRRSVQAILVALEENWFLLIQRSMTHWGIALAPVPKHTTLATSRWFFLKCTYNDLFYTDEDSHSKYHDHFLGLFQTYTCQSFQPLIDIQLLFKQVFHNFPTFFAAVPLDPVLDRKNITRRVHFPQNSCSTETVAKCQWWGHWIND